jgi:hypothetical protein
MSLEDFATGFLKGFSQSGGGQKLSSYAAKNIAGGEYYDPWDDPRFLQDVQQAAKIGTKPAYQGVIEEYGKYIDFPQPNVNTQTTGGIPTQSTLTDDGKINYMFGAGAAGPQTVNAGAVLSNMYPDKDFSYLEGVNVPLSQFSDFMGEGMGILPAEVNKTLSEAGYWNKYGNYRTAQEEKTLTEKATEEALRPHLVNTEEMLGRKYETAGDWNLARKEKTEAETTGQIIDNRIKEGSIVDMSAVMSSYGIPWETAQDYQGVTMPFQDIPYNTLESMRTIGSQLDKLNAEIEEIEANTALTEEEKRTEIAARQNAKQKLNAQIDEIIANTNYRRARTDKVNAETEQIVNPRTLDLSNLPGTGNIPGLNDIPIDEADSFIRALTNMYETYQGINNQDSTGEGEKGRITNFDIPGDWDPQGIDRWGNTNHQVYLDPGGFLRYPDSSYVTDEQGNRWVWEESDKPGEWGQYTTISPGTDLNIPAYQKQTEDNPNWIQNILRSIPGGKEPQWGNNEEQNTTDNTTQKTTSSVNDVIGMYRDRYPDLSNLEIVDKLRGQSESWKEKFKNNYGVSVNAIIGRLRQMR